MRQVIIYYFLLLRGYFLTYYDKLRNYLFNIKKIETSKNKQCKSIYMKYLIVSFLTGIINCLIKFREYFNVKNNTIHIVKLNRQKQLVHYITDSSLVDSTKDMSKLEDSTEKFNGTIMTFELCAEGKSHCLKTHLRKYGNEKNNNHTLNNIALYNGFQHNDKSAEIKIRLFNSGKMVSQSFKWDEVKYKHIKDLIKNKKN